MLSSGQPHNPPRHGGGWKQSEEYAIGGLLTIAGITVVSLALFARGLKLEMQLLQLSRTSVLLLGVLLLAAGMLQGYHALLERRWPDEPEHIGRAMRTAMLAFCATAGIVLVFIAFSSFAAGYGISGFLISVILLGDLALISLMRGDPSGR